MGFSMFLIDKVELDDSDRFKEKENNGLPILS